MKKVLSLVLCLVMLLAIGSLAACSPEEETYEIAVVTDVGQLMDKGFNPEKAATMADAITARLNGQELTRQHVTGAVNAKITASA